MAQPKGRKKPAYTPPAKSNAPKANPVWFIPVIITLLIVGLLWVVATYFFEALFPIPNIGNWNLAIGFGIALVGFGMLTRWR